MAILLGEYFNGTLADWTALDESDITAGAGNWFISATDDCRENGSPSGVLDGPRFPGTFLTYDLGASWTLYNLSLRIASTDNDHIGFMVYYTDEDNYVQFRTASQNSKSLLWKKVGGVQTELASETFTYNTGQWYNYDVTLSSGTINVKRDGSEIFGGDITLTGIASGTVGLYSAANVTSFFDTVIVTDNVPDDPDLVGPKVTQLRVALNQASGVLL